MKVVVVDYGIGNIFSVMAALGAIGVSHVHDTDGSMIGKSDLALVPGVAAFGAGLDLIRSSGQAAALDRHFAAGKPLVGLCLGAQMFLSASEEDPDAAGLGFVGGRVVALDGDRCRVPNQGWLRTRQSGPHAAGERSLVPGSPYFYYSHSYRMEIADVRSEVATAVAGSESVLAVYREQNVTGVQFHPERSGPEGLAFLDRLLSSVG